MPIGCNCSVYWRFWGGGNTHFPFIVLYRWKLQAGAEDTFVAAWSRLTELLKARGSLGSRLHRGPDGIWYGYAQWPSAQARQAAFAEDLDPAAAALMRSAIAESFPEIPLQVVADYLDALSIAPVDEI